MKTTLNVKVIGGADAFSKDNSSFLINFKKNENEYSNILFDCAENSFHYIKDNNIEIDYVFISHTHQDHIGGLEKLIYYNYFFKNKITKIIAHTNIEIEKYLPDNIIYENGEKKERKMYEIIDDLYNLKDEYANYNVNNMNFIKGNHIVKENYGLMIILNDKTTNYCLFITGDSKGSSTIRDSILSFKAVSNFNKKNFEIVVFHDYQMKGSSINSVHCCEDDFEHYYSDLEFVKWFRYHNDEFNNLYKNKNIKIFELEECENEK
jgi:mRNA degradation ribonuclease J1/J2